MAILFISHDLNLIRHVSQRICVMKDGELLETGSTEDVFSNPQHPYTIELLNAEPTGSPIPLVKKGEALIKGKDVRVWFPVKAGFFRKTVDHI